MSDSKNNQTGFSVVETLIVLAVIAVIAALGFWVATKRHNTKPNSQTVTTKALDPKLVGTASGVKALADQEKSDEQTGDDDSAQSEKSAITGDSSNINDIGNSYDESAY